MTQGRKSRTVLGFGCTLAVLASTALCVPAVAAAQAADDEYNLTLPSADGEGDDPAQSAQIAPRGDAGSTADPSGTVAPATADGSPSTDAATQSGAGSDPGHDGARDGDQGGSRAEGGTAKSSVQPTVQTPGASLAADTSDGGGAPVLLFVLAATAAVCTGIAIWRLRERDRDGDGPGNLGPGAPGAAGETR
jgi:hypothetical protein